MSTDHAGEPVRRPKRPERIDPFAESFLRRLQRHGSARAFILGGAFALAHYHEYRRTNDVDAWWRSEPDAGALQTADRAFHETAAEFGLAVETRLRKDVASMYAVNGDGKRIFSFEVAERDIALEPPIDEQSPWAPIAIESLTDNLASKMNALVARGAPRDFLDIKTAVDVGLVDSTALWPLWQKKNPGESIVIAKANVQRHLCALEARRPISTVPEAGRAAAAELRRWFREGFVREREAP